MYFQYFLKWNNINIDDSGTLDWIELVANFCKFNDIS